MISNVKNALVFIGLGALVIVIGLWVISAKPGEAPTTSDITSSTSTAMSTLEITSGVFENGTSIPSRFTCDGENVSLPLSWEGVPGGTQSLALIMDDPDVPKQLKPDGVFDHWTLFNIPPEIAEIAAGSTAGTSGANGAGKNQYTGPCPPPQYEPSEHRYFFRLYALDTELELQEGATKADVLAAMEGHILEQAELMGRYKRGSQELAASSW